MHNLKRFFNQNKSKIIKTLAIIISIFLIIQMMNKFVSRDNEKMQTEKGENELIKNEISSVGTISNKSAVTGQNVTNEKLKSEATIIDEFLNYCNNQDVENAYKLLSNECKQQMYTTIGEFYKLYYVNVFDGKKKIYDIENWFGDTYKVNIYEDLLETGNDSGEQKQDYITVKKLNGEYKLNINSYIGYYEINEKTTNDDLAIEVISKNTYKEYEEYTINVTNKTQNMIKLDDINSPHTLYLEGSKEEKYFYYNHELTQPTMTISAGHTKEITIKFYSSYISNKDIKYIVFSNIISTNGQLSEKMQFRANI